MIVLLWFFQIVFLDSFYKAIKTQSIKASAETIAQNIDNDDLQTLLDRISQQSAVCIRVIGQNGTDLYTSHAVPDCVIHRMPQSDVYRYYMQAKSNGGTALELFSRDSFKNTAYNYDRFKGNVPPPDRGMMQSMIYVKLADRADGSQAVIMLNSTITPVNTTVETLRVQLAYITAILLVLSIVLALFMSKRISKPIIKINSSAKELATGNYEISFDGKGYLEIEELNDTLNYAAKELSKVEGLRRELIANISHDLRTPLTMITGYGEVMRDLPGENTPENVQIIIDEAKRLSTLVNDVLDISKLQSGSQQLTFTEFSLTQSIREILGRYTKLTEQRGYIIKFIADTETYVNADEMKISQVVYNLINNAITYTGKDKSVNVVQSVNDNCVKIEVTDTGNGIPPDKLPFIWDRYYKAGGIHRRAAIGTGLGLSIVKTILDMHNARYGVESSRGHGSTFWFELPMVK